MRHIFTVSWLTLARAACRTTCRAKERLSPGRTLNGHTPVQQALDDLSVSVLRAEPRNKPAEVHFSISQLRHSWNRQREGSDENFQESAGGLRVSPGNL